MTERTEYDPMWPFPQHDKDGKQLLPPPAPREKRNAYPDDVEDALF